MSNVGVLFGGISPEHDISILTGLQAERGLASTTHSVSCIFWAKTNDFYLVENGLEASMFQNQIPKSAQRLTFSLGQDPGFYLPSRTLQKSRRLEIDVVLIALHGGPGEDGTVQSLFDLAGLRYTGPNAAGAALGMDKLAFAGICSDLDLPHLKRTPLTEALTRLSFDRPYILKPRYGGSSIGIDVVADEATATARLKSNIHLKFGAVAEPYRPDLFDLQIAVRTYPKLELSAIERPLRTKAGSEILSYKDKYVAGIGMADAPRELPAKLDESLAEKIRDYARILASAVPLRGVTRIDFLSDGQSELYVNEVNTIPGSLSKYLFVEPALPFEVLLGDLIDEALRTTTFTPTTQGADGTALNSAGSIASKLA